MEEIIFLLTYRLVMLALVHLQSRRSAATATLMLTLSPCGVHLRPACTAGVQRPYSDHARDSGGEVCRASGGELARRGKLSRSCRFQWAQQGLEAHIHRDERTATAALGPYMQLRGIRHVSDSCTNARRGRKVKEQGLERSR
jgi:hypothetical protein